MNGLFRERYAYTDFHEQNLDYLIHEMSRKIPNPEQKEQGQALIFNGTEWVAGSPQSGVTANDVAMTAQSLVNTTDVQSAMAKINTELVNRPVKQIALNNVNITPDANGRVNIQIPDGNNILY